MVLKSQPGYVHGMFRKFWPISAAPPRKKRKLYVVKYRHSQTLKSSGKLFEITGVRDNEQGAKLSIFLK